MKYFTVFEAEEAIPELETVFAVIVELRAKAEVKAALLHNAEAKKNLTISELALATSQLEFLISQMNEWFQKVLDRGALLKGLDPALVDFPYRLDGREVYLCWRLGEKKITHYHGLEEGIAERKSLPQVAEEAS